MDLPKHDVAKSVKFLADDPDLLLAIVFGSAVRGDLRPHSDIDIAVYPCHTMHHRERQCIADKIAEATGRSVDLIDLSTTNGTLLRHILHTGIVVFNKEDGLLGNISQKFLAWQEDFEPLLNRILKARLHRFIAPAHAS